ncbi:MDR family MFS transporter [Paraburkholderia sediminicola]|uniref:MDR family MFS transporter n=1 Tax=Paraburkholderia sediminicola TaxID=458836 RepID=UPI0038BC3C5F
MTRATSKRDVTRPPALERSDTTIMAVLLPLMLVLFISTLDQTIVAAALGRIGAELGDAGNAPWIATSYLLTSAVTTLIFGKLGDMIGRKPVFLASVAIFVVGSALCAAAPNMGWLIAFRAFQGLGGGGLNSLVMAIVGDLVPPRERARYQAVLGIIPAIAIILGPVLGGVIVDHWSWIWIFVINVPIGLLAFGMIAVRLHLPGRARSHQLDIWGSVLAIVFTTSFLLTMVYGGQAYPWSAWQALGLAAVAIVSLLAYLAVEHAAAEPITPLQLFGSGIFAVSATLFFLSTAALFVGMLYVPLMLQSTFRLTASASGASIGPLLLGLIAATMVTGGIISHSGRYKAFPIAGAILSGIGFCALARIDLTTPLWHVLIMLAVIGIGLGFFIQVVVLAGQNAVEHRHLGVATGALNFFKTLGGATGAAVFGSILTARLARAGNAGEMLHAYGSVFVSAAAMMGIALLLALLLREKPLSVEMIEVAEGRVDVPEY